MIIIDIKFKNSSVAQGTIEYLVTIGVIVIIGLAVVSLTTNFFDDAQGISSTTKKIGSSTGVISISEVVIDNDGNGSINFLNNSGESLTITSLSVNDSIIDYPDTVLIQGAENFLV
ncbi:MAG: hypothetical protein PHP82_03650 [Candidatus ainarchaeum sp.]|nr:hypothetical protein [Candidatus ainarchaeum sp.]